MRYPFFFMSWLIYYQHAMHFLFVMYYFQNKQDIFQDYNGKNFDNYVGSSK